MKKITDERSSFQADIYFALATIVQAIILTALGNELVKVIKEPHSFDLPWIIITGLQSLVICVSFWYHFVRDFIFGFRMMKMNARDHFVLAFTYFLIGLTQYVAFQFLDDLRVWYSLVLLSIGCVFINSWYVSRFIHMQDDSILEYLAEGDALSRITGASFIVALICLAVWFTVPEIATPLYMGLALVITALMLGLFIIEALIIFQSQLDREVRSQHSEKQGDKLGS
jgi:hypothetical protein